MIPNPIKVFKIHEGQYELSRKCSQCNKTISMKVNAQDYFDWNMSGKLIQSAFPYLSIAERELLISGMCGACFDNLFIKEN